MELDIDNEVQLNIITDLISSLRFLLIEDVDSFFLRKFLLNLFSIESCVVILILKNVEYNHPVFLSGAEISKLITSNVVVNGYF